MHDTNRLEKNMERYVSMPDQELMLELQRAHEVIQAARELRRQREIGRRAVAHIEWEVTQRVEDGLRADEEVA